MGKHFLWDPVEDNIVKEIDDSGTTIADYTTEPYRYGDLISQHRDGQSRFYHFDGQGSTTALTDSAASIAATYSYSAFGEITARTGNIANPFQYIGRTGSYYVEAVQNNVVRQIVLSSSFGRWYSLIPALLSGYAFQEPTATDGNAGNKTCFTAGNDLLLPPCKKQKLVPFGQLCYTQEDLDYCVKSLNFWAWWGGFVYPCISGLLSNFLDPDAKKDPYCPPTCHASIIGSEWHRTMIDKLGKNLFVWPLKCNSKGSGKSISTYGGPCADPFKSGPNTHDYELSKSIGAVGKASFSMDGTYSCGNKACRPECCLCDVAFTVDYSVTDTYDFISTVPNTALAREPFWCAAIIEHAYTKGGFNGKKTGQTFTTKCAGKTSHLAQGYCDGWDALVILPV